MSSKIYPSWSVHSSSTALHNWINQYLEIAACMREADFDIGEPTAETLDTWMTDLKNTFDWNDSDAVPLIFAEVIITDLIQEEAYDGMIGSTQDYPIKTLLGGSITDIPGAGETIRQGRAFFANDFTSTCLHNFAISMRNYSKEDQHSLGNSSDV